MTRCTVRKCLMSPKKKRNPRNSVEVFPENLRWIENRDVKTRTKMMELQREGWPAGEALAEAIKRLQRRLAVSWTSQQYLPVLRGFHLSWSRRAFQASKIVVVVLEAQFVV